METDYPRFIKQNYYLHTPKYSFNLHVDDLFLKLNGLIGNRAVKLKDVVEIKIGICTGDNKKFLADSPIF
ncbi:MAG: hypothetical protein IPM82_19005 [Saprospiraceae bacterium]|nr:hypothetical protein [Saprospiraceae bacterium]